MTERSNTPFSRSRETVDGVTRRALLAAGVLGFGFSGLIDVLVIHHVLQWHHLVSGIYPTTTMDGLRTNIFADGLFSIGMVIIIGHRRWSLVAIRATHRWSVGRAPLGWHRRDRTRKIRSIRRNRRPRHPGHPPTAVTGRLLQSSLGGG